MRLKLCILILTPIFLPTGLGVRKEIVFILTLLQMEITGLEQVVAFLAIKMCPIVWAQIMSLSALTILRDMEIRVFNYFAVFVRLMMMIGWNLMGIQVWTSLI